MVNKTQLLQIYKCWCPIISHHRNGLSQQLIIYHQ